MLDVLLRDGRDGAAKCLEILATALRAMYAGEVPLDKFGLTKTIRGKYKSPNVPQARVADKMRSRGQEVRSNERVTYVILADQKHLSKKPPPIADRAEDINHAVKTKAPIDYAYYIESAIRQPITQLLSLTIPISKIDAVIEKEVSADRHRSQNSAKRAFVSNMFKRTTMSV